MKLFCEECGAQVQEETLPWRCTCNGPLSCDPDAFSFAPDPSLPGLWRYASALPVAAPRNAVNLGEGMTPLSTCSWNYGSGTTDILCKFDALNPTGSYKDRGISVQISRLKELGLKKLVEDSSGNAGAAMAAYSAAAKIECDIFVPDSTSEGKCVQIAAYGATLRKIPGPREATTEAAEEAAKSIYYASHNWNPYFPEGIKTYAFEVFEQLNNTMPDNVIVPVGQGSLISGAWRGFSQIHQSFPNCKLPKIFGVQSENCCPLHDAWKNHQNAPQPFAKKPTIAEGIASAVPVRGKAVLKAIKESQGGFATVAENEIWAAFEQLALVGLYVEPTSAAAMAGVSKLINQNLIKPGEKTVVLLSGSGLKATDKILLLRANPPQ